MQDENQNQNPNPEVNGQGQQTQEAGADSLFTEAERQRKAFQHMQQLLDSQKQEVSQLKQQIASLTGGQQNVAPIQNTQQNDDVIKYLQGLNSKIEGIENFVNQSNQVNTTKSLAGIVQDYYQKQGITNVTDVQYLYNNLDMTGTGFPNTEKGRTDFLAKYVANPRLIEMELGKTLPNDIEQRKQQQQKIQQININKPNQFTPRTNSFASGQQYVQNMNNNNFGNTTNSAGQQDPNNQWKRVQLIDNGKIGG